MKKILTLLFILTLSSCSSSDDGIEVNPNDVTNTLWVTRYYGASGPYDKYEYFEFHKQDIFTLSIVSPNGIREEQLLVGKYRQDGNNIFCECDNSENKYKDKFPENKFMMVIDEYGQTIHLSTNELMEYLKQERMY